MEAVIDADEAARRDTPVVAMRPAAWRRYVGIAASVLVVVGLTTWFNAARRSAPASVGLVATTTAESDATATDAATMADDMMLASLSDFDIYESLYAMD